MDDGIVDVEMTPAPRVVDTKEAVITWMEKLSKGVLSSSHFDNYWHTWVPTYYSPKINDNCLNFNFNEDEATRVLLTPLEEFICNGDPSVVLQELSQFDKPQTVCGRVFKMGEPTYSCRECGMDNTCVLCVDCFKKSEHRHHKYKMGTSSGGGCCDCGDIEAWKKAPFCETHLAGTQSEDRLNNLPEDLTDRTRIVYDAVLWYAYNYLTLEHINLKTSAEDSFDTFCTVLYNDESHTFEQVINTLTRVIKCTQRTAIEYVTNIDREGRAVVKCSNFQHCNDLKAEIERYTSRHGNKPLKVLVVHAHIVAYQIFAMKLLSWLQTFLGHGEGFRAIFSEVVLKPHQSDPCIIKGILLRDSQLWKSARTHWHRLIISGMLLEYENKKAFAKVFMKNYGSVVKDFIKDDHEHTFSVSSLSVQVFTVPTLAHHLIAHDDALFILLNTFLSECSRKCNKSGKLEFERNQSSQTFKRAQYMLYDLRYLLSAVPATWTDDLRRSFLQGLTIMLDLLKKMQGMDAVARQIGAHMEYEPEWETAFNLHIKLAYCISLILQWCGTDKVVLVKAYRATLLKLSETPCYDVNQPLEVRELADHSVACLPYDVSTKPVSIHLPLSRFLAGLHLHLEKYELEFDGPGFVINKPKLGQIIEPVLRTQVMIAQVHAGMWRRNGYALLNQLYFYHNVKCRTEMLDRDIILLQVGASLIESNEFLIHLLNKFNLLNWASPFYETNGPKDTEDDTVRQTITLVEEFLQLAIVIVGERHIPGVSEVTPQDRIKKEIIQHLCIKPLLHSELNKIIPDDLVHETSLDEIIHDLATFKKPTQGSGQGVYELKDHLYDEYNIFFYHYTKEELSKSEEAQITRRKTAGLLHCCPPPKLPKLREKFTMIVDLLQCDVMLHVMRTVLERCIDLKARSFSEVQLHKVLHLVCYALQEEQSNRYAFLRFSDKSLKVKLPTLIEELLNSPRVEAHKDLIKWTLNLYKQITSKSEESQPCTSHITAKETDAKLLSEKERRAKLAAQRREKIMAQMAAMQNSFIKENAKLFQETSSELLKRPTDDGGFYMDTTENIGDEFPIALGHRQTSKSNLEQKYVCILCQEEQQVSIDGPPLVLAAFVHQATVLCQHRNCEDFMDIASQDPLYLNSNLGPAPHTSTCGHVMHSSCWQKYFENVVLKENRRPYRLRHPASFDVEKQEFLCPLCECLSNTVMPILPPLGLIQPKRSETNMSFREWLSCIQVVLDKKMRICHGVFKCTETCTDLHCTACESSGNPQPDNPECSSSCNLQMHQVLYSRPIEQLLPELGDCSESFTRLFSNSDLQLNSSLNEMLHLYSQATYTRGLNVSPHPTDRRVAPMAWKSCSYTIHAIEVLLRDNNKPLLGNLSSRQRDCIETLIRIMGVLGCTLPQSNTVGSHAMRLLSLIIENSPDGPSILQWDSLGFLIPLTFSLPSLFSREKVSLIPSGGQLELYSLQLVFLCHIVKILITMTEFEMADFMEVDVSDDNFIADILKAINRYTDGLNYQAVWTYVQDACMPFLRCCVLFYHYLTDVPAPATLLEVGGDTFINMCMYLGLPSNPKSLFDNPSIIQLVTNWAKHPEVLSYLDGKPMLIGIEPLPINKLVELPTDYSELINTVSSFTCPNSDHDDSRNPTMCLVCGEILCSQSYCCQTELYKTIVGACNYHAHKCGAGIGIFLRVRDCEILFLASPHRGCFLSPPYLDDYGETDQGLKRGNPLRLCPALYKKLQTVWLSHGIHEEIARSIESAAISNLVPTQWQHL